MQDTGIRWAYVRTPDLQIVLGVVEGTGLLKGTMVGEDSTYLRADASMKAIVHKDTGASYSAYLKKLCQEQGIETPTAEDCRRMDRTRKGKHTSNRDWISKTDVDAQIARLKDGRTRLAYKAEHVVNWRQGLCSPPRSTPLTSETRRRSSPVWNRCGTTSRRSD